MDTCPRCGYVEDFVSCEAQGCQQLAIYEGWYRQKDFTGHATGLIRLANVCREHTAWLICGENPVGLRKQIKAQEGEEIA